MTRRSPVTKMTRPNLWVMRVVWVAGPLALGGPLADALDERSSAVSLVAAVGAWSAWVAGLLALGIPSPVSMTVLRILAPAAVALAAWTTAAGHGSVAGWVWSAGATFVALSAGTGRELADGASWGDESRHPLRPPPELLVGPIQLAWLATVAGVTVGPLLLAAGNRLVGVPALVAGAAMTVVSARALHQLSRRWLVVVPAGVVVHDPLRLRDPVLLATSNTVGMTAASDGGGIVVELVGPVTVTPRVVRKAVSEPRSVTSMRLEPSRPGRLLSSLSDRGRLGRRD